MGAEPYFNALGPVRLDGLLKAGVYGNHATQGSNSPLLPASLDASTNRVALVGELGVGISYQFSPMIAARAGYEMLWVYGVALAPNQGATTDFLASTVGCSASATAFYQGAVASLEFIF